jgi:prepilin-type N-terminal cleavage/methylation domain-containing protein
MKQPLKNRGFSLVELLVVVSIFVIITSVVLFNQNKFSSDISNSNAAYAVALQIRQAQVYGTLVNSNQNANFSSSYGVHLTRNASGGVDNIVLFVDSNSNYTYDSGEPIVNTYTPPEGNMITDVCVYPNPDSHVNGKCFSDQSINTADIVFKRPDPDAIINAYSTTVDTTYLLKNSANYGSNNFVIDNYGSNNYNDGYTTTVQENFVYQEGMIDIVVTSSLGDRSRTVEVTGTGQISVVGQS